MEEKNRNYMYRFWGLLVVVFLGSIALYYILPKEIGGRDIRPIDLLSDLRPVDSTQTDIERAIAQELSQTGQELQHPADSQDSKTSVYQAILEESASDSIQNLIQDFTPNHTALEHFFSQLARRNQLDRPVRIAVLGDSFIEGDIFTDELRRSLQAHYGGAGVGWIAIHSSIAGFRKSIKQTASGWQDHSLVDAKPLGQTIAGHWHTPTSEVSHSNYTLVGGSRPIDRANLYYKSSGTLGLDIRLTDTLLRQTLDPTMGELREFSLISTPTTALGLSFRNTSGQGLEVYGVSLEGNSGVTVDNCSMRGNSGDRLLSVDAQTNQEFLNARSYDLIILQYGLNVASQKVSKYDYYTDRMKRVIAMLRRQSPQSDILVLSVSDRAEKNTEGRMTTMRGIAELHKDQRDMAISEGVAFYSLLGAMRQIGGMVSMAEQGRLANKDYTHITHEGGRRLARLFMESLLIEQKYYDATH